MSGASGLGRLTGAAERAVPTATGLLGATVGAAARESVALQESARRLSINSRMAGQDFVDETTLRRELEGHGMATGIKSADIGEALQAYVGKTGDLASARRNARTFAQFAAAGKVDVGDVASTAGALRNQFKITDDQEMRRALASLYMGGKSGTFEMRDAAPLMDRLAASGVNFQLQGAAGVAKLGALVQGARGATGSGEQATTSVEAAFRQMIAKSDVIKRDTGFEVFADKGKTTTKDPIESIIGIISGYKGNVQKIQGAFDTEGYKAVTGGVQEYNRAANALGKNATAAERAAAGTEALRRMFDGLVQTGDQWPEVVRDFAKSQQDSSAQATAAWEQFKSGMADSLVPAVEGTAKHLDLVGVALSPFTDKIANTLEDITSFGNALKKLGIGGGEDGGPKDPAAEMAKVQAELVGLDERSRLQGGKLTASQRGRKRMLEDKKIELAGDISALKPNQVWGPDTKDFLKWTPDDVGPDQSKIKKALDVTGPVEGTVDTAIGGAIGRVAPTSIGGEGDAAAAVVKLTGVPGAVDGLIKAVNLASTSLDKLNRPSIFGSLGGLFG